MFQIMESNPSRFSSHRKSMLRRHGLKIFSGFAALIASLYINEKYFTIYDLKKKIAWAPARRTLQLPLGQHNHKIALSPNHEMSKQLCGCVIQEGRKLQKRDEVSRKLCFYCFLSVPLHRSEKRTQWKVKKAKQDKRRLKKFQKIFQQEATEGYFVLWAGDKWNKTKKLGHVSRGWD